MKTTQRSTKKWNHRNTVARRKRLREVHDLLRELPNLTAKQEARLELLMAERRGEVVINVRKKKFLYRIDQDAMRVKMPPFRIQREPPMSDHMLSTAYSLMYAFARFPVPSGVFAGIVPLYPSHSSDCRPRAL